MHTQTAFTSPQHAAIAALRRELAKRVKRTVSVDFGTTDDGKLSDVAFVVDELPEGAFGRPGPLVSILTGPSNKGEGFVVMGADGAALAEGVSLARAVQSARVAAVRKYREMARGALKVA
ncbi:hypothetical protein WKW79_35160 [Variovorax robiniae]|uniref:Uncharacterized protein n=1 Tax=Variovorax robiniae TaxID=1836199 RepID=A0ABU8XK09_9BURK